MQQGDLFQLEPPAPPAPAEVPGLRLVPDYLNANQEHFLLEQVEKGSWQTDYKRRIQQYGVGYASGRGQPPTWSRDFPDWLMQLARRIQRDAPMERLPENSVINEYVPPQGIGPHKDYPAFGPSVACVSLGSDVILDFTEPEEGLRVPVLVPARSLWVITGPARWQWEHGIAPRLRDVVNGQRRTRGRRISITFRTAKTAEMVPEYHRNPTGP
jgi:alkylated DNA repair dioxygenase AlkB